MNPRILFLFNEKDKELYRTIRQELVEHLKSTGNLPAPTTWAVSEQQAWEYIQEQEEEYDLIIAHIHVPENSGLSIDESECRGLRFLQELGSSYRIPSILLTPAVTDAITLAVGELHQCTALPIKMKETSSLVVNQASQKLETVTTSIKPERIKLDININLDESRCEMIPIGAGIYCEERPFPLQVNPDRIKKLLRTSMRVKEIRDKYPYWKEALEDIGDDLMKEIFRSKEAYALFQNLRDKVGGLENISIRFYVNRQMHPLILEALNEYSGGHREFWMLKTPICRKYDIGIGKLRFPPLFEDEETRTKSLNCLIIKAVVSGWADEINKNLQSLKNIEPEANKIELLSQQYARKPTNVKIDVLEGDVSEEAVQTKLENGTIWHIVHFAGHSYYVPCENNHSQGCGFVALQKDKGCQTRVQSVPIKLFGNWLRKARTRFVYMSSCDSSNDDFVYELASNGIPAVLGFRWDLEDSIAAEHVEHFYKNLFQLRSLEYAFMSTRQKMYYLHKMHNIWAAPMLMMQCRQ